MGIRKFSRLRDRFGSTMRSSRGYRGETNAVRSDIPASEFFKRYDGIEKYITCHPADAIEVRNECRVLRCRYLF